MNSQRNLAQVISQSKQNSHSSGSVISKHNRTEWQKPQSNSKSKIPSSIKSNEKIGKSNKANNQNHFFFNTSALSNHSQNKQEDQIRQSIDQMQDQNMKNNEMYQNTQEPKIKSINIKTVMKEDINKGKIKAKNRILGELQNHLVNYNSQKNSFAIKNNQDLAFTISSFQSSTKAQKQIRNNTLDIYKNSQQEDFKSDEIEKKSMDSDIDTQDINESYIMKRSCSLPKIEDSTPKSLSIISNLSRIKPQDMKKINSGRESRNQLQLPYNTQNQDIKLDSPMIDIELVDKMPSTQNQKNPKTPQDIFQYKLKPQTKVVLKSGCNIFKSKENSIQSNYNTLHSKSKITSQLTILKNSESQESMLQLAAKEFEKHQFLYNTVQVPPPNSVNMETPTQQYSYEKLVPFETIDQNNLKTNIKVVARFRPFNKIENELIQIQENEKIIHFYEDQKSVKVKEDFYSHSNNLTFTFDHVFQSQTSQEQVFDLIGKETINDIMNGYNGTIFAYGQTGSGKTYSMYGLDIYDEQLMGIIPRSARQIFNTIKEQDLEIEYQIRIQMVEIYKETLRDLLHDSPEQPCELKIKEDPKRGTYVEGLTEVCIVNEEEIMSVLCAGETMRQVASTHLNQVSSRSHSICIIEIVQKYPNDSEKKGILNLVDLAGSERVSKSHAKGQALEEAKKINFSLSMLGKVINCLTKSASFIPYRDSKLTRLLKESLGGNNKTTLLVTCSTHQFNIDETVSTLRFAQSAKFIQNRVKMNIKTSPEQLQVIIEQLKQELRCAKQEIYKLMINNNFSQTNSSNKKQELEYNHDDFLYRTCDPQNQIAKQCLHNRPHQSLSSKNYDVIETNNQKISLYLPQDLSMIPLTGTPNFISPVKNFEFKLAQLIRRNEDLEMRLKSKDSDYEALKQQELELKDKVSTQQDKILNYKQKLVVLEKRVAEFESDKDFMIINEVKQERMLGDSRSQIQVLNQQVKCLEQALWESEQTCQDLLHYKQTMQQKSFQEFIKEKINLNNINVSQALENFINLDSQLVKRSFISKLELDKYLDNQIKLIDQSKIEISLLDQDLLKHNIYSMELVNAIEECQVRPEITIYLLKQLLMDAALANHNLQRILAINRWKQIIEFGKHKIKSELCKIQETTIESLEQILEKSRTTHDKLRGRVDKLENYLYDNRNYYNEIVQQTEGAMGCNPTIIFSQSKDNTCVNKKLLNNQDGINTSQVLNLKQIGNQKSRFVRTITNKNLGKAMQFIERSPYSRASVMGGAANISNLSQCYGQIQKDITPMRTCGMHSPIIQQFKSPLRRQNTFIIPRMRQPKITAQNTLQAQAVTSKANLHQKENKMDLGFEDAIQNFFNNNEKEEIPLIEEKKLIQSPQIDLEKIEQMTSVDEIKEYLRQKLTQKNQQEEDKNNLPMIAQYQHASNQQQQEQQSENLINNNTTNNNALYAISNDYYGDNMAPSMTQNLPSNNSANENQRQEHVLTMASEYLLTNNSVIGPAGFFNNGHICNQYHQNEYLDRLQEKIVQLQEEVETQKCRAEEHKKAYYESKKQIESMRQLMEDTENIQNTLLRNEIKQWENAVSKLKEMNEIELQRKQKEIQYLHELLAQWIDNYQELEVNRGFQPHNIEMLLLETLRHKRNKSNCEIVKTQPSTTNTLMKVSTQGDQSENNKISKLSKIKRYSGISVTQENYSLDTHTIDNQNIKGDNSPITQDDSCLELDNSLRQGSKLEIREKFNAL